MWRVRLNNYFHFFIFFILNFFYALHSSHHERMSMHDRTLDDLTPSTHTNQHLMHGMYGRYPMEREISGTDWQPESIPMDGLHYMHNEWLFMTHDFLNAAFTHQSGPRGGNQIFTTSMFMATAQRDFGEHYTFAARTMFSLDPLNGKKGYRLLLQTGETANGVTPLIDRQHPHDLFNELALVQTIVINKDSSIFFYFGLPGEPALGPPVYMMRYSGTYNPEAPISHHWLDSTHVQFGVFTVGYIWRSLKFDTSVFTGREPDQHRFDFERPRFDSFSIRATVNPTPDLSAQISLGFLKSPEQLEPDVNITRSTASCSYNFVRNKFKGQLTGCWGRNQKHPGTATNALLLETTIDLHDKHYFFGRTEFVQKDELFTPPDPRFWQIFNVGKLTIGYIYQLIVYHHIEFGIGALGSVIFIPHDLVESYGNNPFSGTIFLQMRIV